MGEEVKLTDEMLPFLKPGLIVIGEDYGWDIQYGLVGITPDLTDSVERYDKSWTSHVNDLIACTEEGVRENPDGLFLVVNDNDRAFLMKGYQLLDPRMNLEGLRIGMIKKGNDK